MKNIHTTALAFATTTISSGAFAVTAIGAGVSGNYAVCATALTLAAGMLVLAILLEKVLAESGH